MEVSNIHVPCAMLSCPCRAQMEKKAKRDGNEATVQWDPERIFHAFTEYGGSDFLTLEERVPLSGEHTRLVRTSTTALSNITITPSTSLTFYNYNSICPAYRVISSLNQFPRLQQLTLGIEKDTDHYLPWDTRLPALLTNLCVDGGSDHLPLSFISRLRLHTLQHLRTLELGYKNDDDINVVENLLLASTDLPHVERLTIKTQTSPESLFKILTTFMCASHRMSKLSALGVKTNEYGGFRGILIPSNFLKAAVGRRLSELKIECVSKVVFPTNLDFPPPESMNVILIGSDCYIRSTIVDLLRPPLQGASNPCVQAWGMRMFIGYESNKLMLDVSDYCK
jgi:hypothetical protein